MTGTALPDRDAARALVDAHLQGDVRPESAVQHVEYDPAVDRWYVRFGCEGRDAATIYVDLRQRSLRFELYFLPLPEGGPRRDEVVAFLMRRNHGLHGVHFSVGPDGDAYLTGRILLRHLDVEELDLMIGTIYEAVEGWFPAAVGIAYGPRPPSDAPVGPGEPT